MSCTAARKGYGGGGHRGDGAADRLGFGLAWGLASTGREEDQRVLEEERSAGKEQRWGEAGEIRGKARSQGRR